MAMAMASGYSSVFLPEYNSRKTKYTLMANARVQQPSIRGLQNITSKTEEEFIQSIRETFGKKVELSVSSYDTAWVAMVPSKESPRNPSFPRCLDWVKENQLPDGSWGGLSPSHPLLVKDRLSSTLACILALETWDAGKSLVQKGLDFIQSNSWAAQDKRQYSPIGFDIIFSGMINFSKELGLRLPLDPSMVEVMVRNRELGIERSHEGKIGDLAYVAEGFGTQYDWKELLIKHRRSNGSLFNSPSTTAAALTHLHDDKCHGYLESLLQKYEYGVPTIYPFNIYPRLQMVDSLGLGKLGIEQYFKNEIKFVLDETYRCGMQRNEELILDPKCRAMAFRLLRLNGYVVSAEALKEFEEQAHFFSSVSAQFTEPRTILELYRASQIKIHQEEQVLEKIEAWTSSYLKQMISNEEIQNQVLREEIEHALAYPRGRWERTEVRRYIERYNAENFNLAKTSYRCSSSSNRDFLAFAQKKFNDNQSIYQEEIKHVERWLKDTRLEQLSSVRKRVPSTVFTAAGAGLYHPELSAARHSWTKNGILATVIDDFFDVTCTKEELINLTEKLEKWDEHSAIEFSSEQVEILFYAIYNTTNEYIAKASREQGRSVKDHLKVVFFELATHMMKEYDWQTEKKWPDYEEYLSNGWITIALKPVVLTPLYLLGASLSKEAVESEEYYNMCKHMSIIGRLLNDIVTFKREDEAGKLNSLSLYGSHVNRVLTPDEATEEIRKIIDSSRRELLRMVVQTEGSVVPRPCKDLFWTTSETLHNIYAGIDGLSLVHTIIHDINATIYDPIVLPENKDCTRS